MKKVFTKLSAIATTAMTTLTLGAGQVLAQGSKQSISKSGAEVTAGTGYATDIVGLLNAVLSFVMVLAALLVFVYLIWGGIEWITSGGDKGKTESARNKITAAIIGLIVLAASYAILQLVLRFLGFDSLDDALNFTTIS